MSTPRLERWTAIVFQHVCPRGRLAPPRKDSLGDLPARMLALRRGVIGWAFTIERVTSKEVEEGMCFGPTPLFRRVCPKESRVNLPSFPSRPQSMAKLRYITGYEAWLPSGAPALSQPSTQDVFKCERLPEWHQSMAKLHYITGYKAWLPSGAPALSRPSTQDVFKCERLPEWQGIVACHRSEERHPSSTAAARDESM